MLTGSVLIPRPRPVVVDRLRVILAGANCTVLESSEDRIRFRHGTYLSQTAPLLPKTCDLRLEEESGSTRVRYEVRVAPFIRFWFTLMGILFCWAIFPPFLAYRALVHHPRLFVENALAGV
jgi:hypothetical protein